MNFGLFLILLVNIVEQIRGHGRLIEPPSRASAWRYGFDTPHNYNDHELYCGGFTRQWVRNGGKCGICGDAWDAKTPRPHDFGGTYGQGVIVRKYAAGATVTIRVELTANHNGYFEFSICPNYQNPTQECLNKNRLKLAKYQEDTEHLGYRYFPKEGNKVYEMKYKIPKKTCEHCVLQWRYIAASRKLGLDGSILVLERNGTTVDEDVLVHVRDEILILLEKDQIWTPPGPFPLSTASQSSSSLVVSLPSTNTVLVEGSEEYANQFLNMDIESAGNSERTPTVGSKVLQELVQNIEITHTIDCNSENFWLQLEVPFNKLNHKEIEEMSNGVRNSRTRKKLVHLVVDEMRNYKETIPTKAFRYIAKKIVDKYPATFKDIDEDGVVLGDGTYSLVMKMQEHHNYLNRPHKRKAPANDNNPVANKKRLLAARSGCVDFAPIPSSFGESVEELKAMALQNDDIEEIVEKTFPEVRKFLNRNPFPSVGEIKEEWPIVFSRKGIFLHFNRLTNSRIELLANMKEKEEQIRKCSRTTSSDGGEIGLMKTIISHFKEKIESVIVEVEDFNDKECLERSLPSTPCIIKVGNNWGNCPNGTGAVGCGPQEEFRACADVKIVGKGAEEPMVSEEPTTYPVSTSTVLPIPTSEKPTSEESFSPITTFIISIISFLVVCLIFCLLYFHFYQVGKVLRNWVAGPPKEKNNFQNLKAPPLPPQAPPRAKRSRSPDIFGYEIRRDSLA